MKLKIYIDGHHRVRKMKNATYKVIKDPFYGEGAEDEDFI